MQNQQKDKGKSKSNTDRVIANEADAQQGRTDQTGSKLSGNMQDEDDDEEEGQRQQETYQENQNRADYGPASKRTDQNYTGRTGQDDDSLVNPSKRGMERVESYNEVPVLKNIMRKANEASDDEKD